MRRFKTYVREAEAFLNHSDPFDNALKSELDALLNGGPSKALRKAMSVEELRRQGAFFTGQPLAQKLVGGLPNLWVTGRAVDPTCGAGDLLLAAATKLPVRKTLTRTLLEWGTRLAGWDTEPVYVRLTRTRLALLALQRGANHDHVTPADLEYLFPLILQGDALGQNGAYENADCILLNPPFGLVLAPNGCEWASGKVTAAALFAEKVVDKAHPGTHFAMILPDVLRSGSRYRRWRECIQRQAQVLKVEPHGLFDRTADVDVFLLHLVKRQNACAHLRRCAIMPESGTKSKKVSDLFDVHVGPMVPFRDKKTGPLRPFIAAKTLPKWCVCEAGCERRRTDGKGFLPPFVVVRRTSRPSDAHRAVATVIAGDEEIAVENHLLVLTPHDGKLETCKELLARLEKRTTDRWLDKRIRCRHLTVSAIQEVPW